MRKKEVAERYLHLLQQSDLNELLNLFAPDAIVISPVYGERTAKDFYQVLLEDTNNSKLELKGIFSDESNDSMALHFLYHWTLKNGSEVTFEVVDIIEFDPGNKIKKLTIIYDTVRSRKLVSQLKT